MFTFGGGYVVIPLMEKYFVNKKGYLTQDELYQLSTIAQTAPGAIAVNLSVLVGQKVNHKMGALVSGIASILPSFILLSIISLSYSSFSQNHMVNSILKGMESGVAAIIIDLVLTMFRQLSRKEHFVFLLIPISTFIFNFLLNINPIIIIIFTVIFIYIIFKKLEGGK
ncbi:chromate transporter [Carnobacterium maltaromaticum]|nr:chromate transporter [Carnobacterium maltaromaticum]